MSNDKKRLDEKLHAMMDDVLGRQDGMVKVAYPNSSMANNSYRTYRNSFLTLSDMQIPDDFREIFKWCRYYFKFDSLIGPVVRKQATFPITDYVVNDSQAAEEDDSIEEKETSEQYKFYNALLKDLNLHKHLIEIGYDYFLYANCIIFAEPGTKRVKRRNPDTGEIEEKLEVVWKSVRRLDPANIRINLDPKTQEKIYYYEVPERMRRVIRNKRPKSEYDRIPKIFKDAVEKKGIIKLNSKFVYSFSMPSESGDSGLWATPPIMHAMKLLMYTNVLRQAQEAIAYEHIIPKRIYYFEPNGQWDASAHFGQIADDFAFELKKQINDPNYQVISPIPVQQIQHGGQGRNLLLVPEIEQLQNTILAAMNVPREFIFGGLSYSGSTTSLRILENDFITYRNALEDYVNNFLIKRLAELRGEWETTDDDDKLVTVSFADLKMQDDIQQKELMVRLNQQQKLPDEILYEKVFGLDASKVKEQLQTEARDNLENQFELQMLQMKLQQKMKENMMEMGIDPQIAQQAAPGAEQTMPTEEQPEAAMQPQQQPQGQPQQQGQQQQGQQQPSQEMIEQFVQELLKMDEMDAEVQIAHLPPNIQQTVMQYYLRAKDDQEMQTDMRPQPEILPPRREGGV